jgi:uncharacterized membrane protein YcaP (DUF421 family)
MDIQELLMTALRAIAVYILVFIVIRLMGKRAVGNFSAFDLLVALMIGEIVDEMIYGDVTFLQGAIPIIIIMLMHEANAWLSYSKHGFSKLLEGTPSIIIKDGELQRKGMRRERMNEEDVLAQLRLQDIDVLREVKLAIVENDGQVSVIRQSWAAPLQKADLGGEAARQKDAATGSQEKSPAQRYTDTSKVLS